MSELRQQLIVELSGKGNLPAHLEGAAKQSKAAGQGVLTVRQEAERLGKVSLRGLLNPLTTRQVLPSEASARPAKPPGFDWKSAAATYASGMGMVGSVGLYSPAAAERFSWAVKDFGAAIGRDLLPSLEKGTRWVYDLQKAYLSLSPGTRKVIADTIFYGTVLAGGVLAYRGIALVAGAASTMITGLAARIAALSVVAGNFMLGAGAGGAAAAGASGGLLAGAGGFARKGLKGGLYAWLAYEAGNLFANRGDEYGGLSDKFVGSVSRGIEGSFRWLFQGKAGFREWNRRAGLIEREKWGLDMTPGERAELQRYKDKASKDAGGGEMLAARPAQIFAGAEDFLRSLQMDVIQSPQVQAQRDLTDAIRELILTLKSGGGAAGAGMVGGGAAAGIVDMSSIGGMLARAAGALFGGGRG
jgi:hypothetical protein